VKPSSLLTIRKGQQLKESCWGKEKVLSAKMANQKAEVVANNYHFAQRLFQAQDSLGSYRGADQMGECQV
jgi:hypothetical protein